MLTTRHILKLASTLYLKQRDFIKTVLCSVAVIFSLSAYSSTPSVAVIYPELRAPFNKIFTDMADGVEKEINGSTVRYILKKDYSPQQLNQWMNENNIQACVALGVRGEKATSALEKDIPIILGGMLAPKSNSDLRPGISLAPSPDKLFEKLKIIKPDAREVIVVYNPKKTTWLIQKAQVAAVKHQLKLVTYTTMSLSESAKIYREIFKRKNIADVGIWLPPDPTSVDNKAVLSFILDQAWRKNITVFSSSLAHVNKGVLFAMYPDNIRLGQSLGKVALNELNKSTDQYKGIVPVTDLLTAFNRRTAEHLGINVTSTELRSYDAVFPSK